MKSCLTLCRHILGNELEEITQNRMKFHIIIISYYIISYHFILGKWVNN